MRAAFECIHKFLGARMNFSVGTCAGLFITQHLKVSHFFLLRQTPPEQLHMMSYLREEEKKERTQGPGFQPLTNSLRLNKKAAFIQSFGRVRWFYPVSSSCREPVRGFSGWMFLPTLSSKWFEQQLSREEPYSPVVGSNRWASSHEHHPHAENNSLILFFLRFSFMNNWLAFQVEETKWRARAEQHSVDSVGLRSSRIS